MDRTYRKRLPIWFKLILLIVLMAIIMAGVTIAVGYSTYSSDNNRIYEGKAWALAGTQALMLDPGKVATVRKMVQDTLAQIPAEEQVQSNEWGSAAFLSYLAHFSWIEDTPEYRDLKENLQVIRQLNGLNSCYIVYVDTDDPRCVYLVDASNNYCPPGVIDPLYDFNRAVLEDPTRGFPSYFSNTEEYGWLVTAGVPIQDASGKVIAYSSVDIDMNTIRKRVDSYYLRLVVVLALLTVLLIVVFLVAIHRQVVSPIRKLSEAARKYTQERKLGTEEMIFGKLSIHRGDEIGDLTDAMQLMEHETNEYVRNLSEAQMENEKINSELSVAMRMQMDIMPTTDEELSGITAVDLHASMNPAKEVGGDFYDFFLIDRDHLAMIMADVSGRGVPAATFMVIAKTILKDRTLAGGSPAEVLEQVNRLLCRGNREQMFVTVWLGVLKLSNGVLVMANAGHDYPAIRRGNGLYELYRTENDPPLAAADHLVFHDMQITLQPGDELFVYTDGIPEAKDSDGGRFGIKRMLEALNRTSGLSAEEINGVVEEAVREFVGDAEAFDDVTMMSVLYRGEQEF